MAHLTSSEVFSSSRLSYRLIRNIDKPQLFSMFSNKNITEKAGLNTVYSKNEFELVYMEMKAGKHSYAIIFNNICIGYAQTFKTNVTKEPYCLHTNTTLGLIIDMKYQNNGFGTEALNFFTQMLRKHYEYIFVSHFKENMASKKIIEKAGYQFVEKKQISLDSQSTSKECYVYVFC